MPPPGQFERRSTTRLDDRMRANGTSCTPTSRNPPAAEADRRSARERPRLRVGRLAAHPAQLQEEERGGRDDAERQRLGMASRGREGREERHGQGGAGGRRREQAMSRGDEPRKEREDVRLGMQRPQDGVAGSQVQEPGGRGLEGRRAESAREPARPQSGDEELREHAQGPARVAEEEAQPRERGEEAGRGIGEDRRAFARVGVRPRPSPRGRAPGAPASPTAGTAGSRRREGRSTPRPSPRGPASRRRGLGRGRAAAAPVPGAVPRRPGRAPRAGTGARPTRRSPSTAAARRPADRREPSRAARGSTRRLGSEHSAACPSSSDPDEDQGPWTTIRRREDLLASVVRDDHELELVRTRRERRDRKSETAALGVRVVRVGVLEARPTAAELRDPRRPELGRDLDPRDPRVVERKAEGPESGRDDLILRRQMDSAEGRRESGDSPSHFANRLVEERADLPFRTAALLAARRSFHGEPAATSTKSWPSPCGKFRTTSTAAGVDALSRSRRRTRGPPSPGVSCEW